MWSSQVKGRSAERQTENALMLVPLRIQHSYRIRGLPRELTPFVGRQGVVALLRKAVDERVPLLTVWGPGGIGKTRVVTHALSVNGRAVAFVDLTTARGRVDVIEQVAATLQVPVDASHVDAVEAIGEALEAVNPRVLVLDNGEQVAGALADLVRAWLPSLTGTTIVTSRVKLGIYGERAVAVDPLPADDTVRLFVERLRAHGLDPKRPGPELVARLEGSPLAIELAAGRASVLSISELTDRLEQPLTVLQGGEGPVRHRSLRTVIEWSWELLSAADQEALSRLSVLPDGFSLDAFGSLTGRTREEAAAAVKRLQNSSWLQRRDVGDARRFYLRETTRAFALTHLSDEDAAVRAAAEWVVQWGETVTADVVGLAEIQGLLEPEVSALSRVLELHDQAMAPLGLRAGLLLLGSVIGRGGYTEYIVNMSRHLATVPESRPWALGNVAVARVQRLAGSPADGHERLRAASDWCHVHGERDVEVLALSRLATSSVAAGDNLGAVDAIERAAELVDGQGESARLAYLVAKGAVMQAHRDPEVATLLAEAVTVASRLGDGESLANAYLTLHRASMRRGDLAGAEAALVAASKAIDPAMSQRHHSRVLGSMSSLKYAMGDVTSARAYAEESLALNRRLGRHAQVAALLQGLVMFDLEVGERLQAELRHAEATEIGRNTPSTFGRVYHLTGTGMLALFNGRLDNAADWFDEAAALMAPAQPKYAADFRVWAAIQAIVAGDLDLAEAKLQAAEAHEPYADLVQVARDHLLFARARSGGPAPGALAEEARTRLLAARHPTGPGPNESGYYVRLAAKLALEAASQSAADESPFMVHVDGTWFRTTQGETVHLGRRRAMRRIMHFLASAEAGNTYAWDDLFEQGWPGERATPESARQRVYVALSSLRKLGLADVLLTEEDGYLLAPGVVRVSQ